jgi:RNA polymerase sigma-70 factor (ECF subfamily)
VWPDEEHTRSLLAQARQGDAQAVNRLLGDHREPLRQAVGLRMDPVLKQRVDASDIVQEVLIEANRRLPDYLRAPEIPFSLWLRQMAQDRLIDAHRRHRAAARRSLDREQPLAAPAAAGRSSLDLAGEVRDQELTPARAAVWNELRARFHEAVALLEAQDREIILLRHFEQLSNMDAARALGVSPAAAGMRHLRAVRRLRALLAVPPSASAD